VKHNSGSDLGEAHRIENGSTPTTPPMQTS
jgi:hypothetical protein